MVVYAPEVGGVWWMSTEALATLFDLDLVTMPLDRKESLHIPFYPPLLLLSHAFRQMRLQVQERPRGAFRREP